MTGVFDIFDVEAGGPGAGLLTPGRVLRALALGADVSADDVGLMTPGKRGELRVEIARHRTHGLATPRLVPSHDAGHDARPVVFVLRRPDDEPDPDTTREVLVSWDDGGPAPAPGAVAVALAEAAGGFPEDLGFGLAGASFLRVQVPLGMVLGGLPAVIMVSPQRTLRIEVDARKKA